MDEDALGIQVANKSRGFVRVRTTRRSVSGRISFGGGQSLSRGKVQQLRGSELVRIVFILLPQLKGYLRAWYMRTPFLAKCDAV